MPTIVCLDRELAQMARALGLGPRGREFESRIPEVICTMHVILHWRTGVYCYVRNTGLCIFIFIIYVYYG